VTVLDAHAVIAFLTDEPARPRVEAILRTDGAAVGIGAANLAECIDVLVRLKRVPGDQAADALRLVLQRVEVLPVDEAIGRLAGALRARHYERDRRPLSLADCLALATAKILERPLATADPPLLEVAVAEQVEVIALPDQWADEPQPPPLADVDDERQSRPCGPRPDAGAARGTQRRSSGPSVAQGSTP